MADTVEELDALYVAEQDAIAKKRKAGGYATEAEDIKAQKDSWENYLLDKYKITQDKADKKAIITYYGDIVINAYSATRDTYYATTTVEAADARINVLINFESNLIIAGVLDKQTTTEVKEDYIDQLKEIEALIKKDRTPVSNAEFDTLCKQQMPVAVTYIQSFKK